MIQMAAFPANCIRQCVIAIAAVGVPAVFVGCSDAPTADEAGEVARRAALQQSTTLTVTPEELKRQLNCWQANFVMQGNDIKEASL